jgi:hypothetical protein
VQICQFRRGFVESSRVNDWFFEAYGLEPGEKENEVIQVAERRTRSENSKGAQNQPLQIQRIAGGLLPKAKVVFQLSRPVKDISVRRQGNRIWNFLDIRVAEKARGCLL